MFRARRTFVATGLVALLAVAGVTAAIAADPAPAPPPRIAFLANGIVPADALAAGPIAGQLGAPVFTTQQDLLPAGTADALDDYDPELVIVMGGPVAISDAVVTQVSAATGLPAVDPTPAPDSGVVRAAGGDRFETATIVADLLAAYAPAYLPVDDQAVDADLLDGMDSTEFLKNADPIDADTVDGKDSTAFVEEGTILGAVVLGDGTLVSGRHAVDATRLSEGRYVVEFDRSLVECVRVATPGEPGNGTEGATIYSTEISSSDPSNHSAFVGTYDTAGTTLDDNPFHLMILC